MHAGYIKVISTFGNCKKKMEFTALSNAIFDLRPLSS